MKTRILALQDCGFASENIGRENDFRIGVTTTEIANQAPLSVKPRSENSTP